MGINLRKTTHILFFIVLLPVISLSVGYGFAKLSPYLPFWVETLSPLAAYGLLYGIFEKHAWHWPLFRLLGIVSTPDVRGRWLGKQTSSFKDTDGKARQSRVIMEIKQTFSTIHVTTYYKNWHTTHSLASFIVVEDQCVLFVMFETTPRVDYDGEASAHKGLMRLIQLPDKTVTGTYFNAQGRSGELQFKRTQYTLHQTFDGIEDAKSL